MKKTNVTPLRTLIRPLAGFQHEIENRLGVKLNLKINDNRSTMLSVKWEPDTTKVSLHRIFLDAPQNVMDALACYIRKEHKIISPVVKAYIEDSLKKLDYSHQLDPNKLYTHGNIYNLKSIYDQLNNDYFRNQLDLSITWFGKPSQKNKSRVTFGLYYDSLKLIKINRLMDSPSFPDYFVFYVVYHEMVHSVCRPYVDEVGRSRVHSNEFKEREQQFQYFDLAQSWIKENKTSFF